MRILVIDTGVLGDTVHALPALWDIRKAYPAAELHFVTSPVGGEILRLAGCADHVWTMHQDRAKRTVREQFKVVGALRNIGFDLSINFTVNDRDLAHAALIGARRRIAFRHKRWHFWNPWLVAEWVGDTVREVSAFEQRRRNLALAGIPVAPSPCFGISIPREASEWAASNTPASFVHLGITASKASKEWPISRWAALVRKLAARHVQTLATGSGSARESERLEALRREASSPGFTTLSQGLTIPRFAAVLSRCRLHVGTSSGATQLAMGLGRPTVSMFLGRQDAVEWGPKGESARTLVREETACLADITPEEVAERVFDLLA